MKTIIFLFVFMILFSVSLCAEAFRKAGEQSLAEIRAEEYRNRYEVCDEHHDCINETAGLKPFIHVPLWL